MRNTTKLILLAFLLGSTFGCSDSSKLETPMSQFSSDGVTAKDQTESSPLHPQDQSEVETKMGIRSPEEAIRNLQGAESDAARQYLLENPQNSFPIIITQLSILASEDPFGMPLKSADLQDVLIQYGPKFMSQLDGIRFEMKKQRAQIQTHNAYVVASRLNEPQFSFDTQTAMIATCDHIIDGIKRNSLQKEK